MTPVTTLFIDFEGLFDFFSFHDTYGTLYRFFSHFSTILKLRPKSLEFLPI